MKKHLLRWKNSKCKRTGRTLPYLKEINIHYRGTLLSRILAMKKQRPIELESAVQLLMKYEHAARKAGRKGADPGHLCWYQYHFLEWLNGLGYHIELTGDEFESAVISELLV